MWTPKHVISSHKFYEIIINTELKGYTAMDLKNFYKHIKMCLNEVTRLREDLIPAYQSIKRHSEFEKNSSHIVTTFTIIGMLRPTLTLDTHC